MCIGYLCGAYGEGRMARGCCSDTLSFAPRSDALPKGNDGWRDLELKPRREGGRNVVQAALRGETNVED